MKSLKEYVNESINVKSVKMVNESNPESSFKVTKPFSTSFMWEYYTFVENPERSDDPEIMEEVVDRVGFREFLKYAEKKHWKKDRKGYYIIPKGTELNFDGSLGGYLDHIARWEIDNSGVYVSMTYDEIIHGEYDDYLEEW